MPMHKSNVNKMSMRKCMQGAILQFTIPKSIVFGEMGKGR